MDVFVFKYKNRYYGSRSFAVIAENEAKARERMLELTKSKANAYLCDLATELVQVTRYCTDEPQILEITYIWKI